MTTTLPVAGVRESWALARTVLGRRRAALVGAAVMFAVDGFAGLVAPWQLGRIVDIVTGGGSPDEIVVAAVWVLVAALASFVGTWAAIALLAQAGQPALAELREQVLHRSLHLDTETLEAAGAGDLLSRVGDDVRVVSDAITEVVPLMVSSAIAIVFTAGGLFALDWRLGLAGLAVLPVYALGLRWYLPRSGPVYRAERAANGERAEALITAMHSSRSLRAFGLGARQQAEVESTSWRAAGRTIEAFRLLTRFGARQNRAEAIGLLLILVTGYLLVGGDEVTVGAVTTAALFFHRLFNPIGAVMHLFDDAQSAGASLTRLAGVALLPAPESRGDARRPADGRLEARDVGHAYVPGRPVLAGVDLDLEPGRRVAVVGATGAGKSTLGAAVAGLLAPTSGRVRVGGVPLDEAADRDGRPVAVLVSQDVHVFTGTVRDNLQLAAPAPVPDDDVLAALALVGARGWVGALPDGLDTAVGDGAHALTPAQAQQLALARVALADPLLVVLDEATAEAGSAGARDLEVAATAVTRGRTAVVIAHRLTQAVSADHVVVLDAGRVVETGTHDELVAAGGTYAGLWSAWSATTSEATPPRAGRG